MSIFYLGALGVRASTLSISVRAADCAKSETHTQHIFLSLSCWRVPFETCSMCADDQAKPGKIPHSQQVAGADEPGDEEGPLWLLAWFACGGVGSTDRVTRTRGAIDRAAAELKAFDHRAPSTTAGGGSLRGRRGGSSAADALQRAGQEGEVRVRVCVCVLYKEKATSTASFGFIDKTQDYRLARTCGELSIYSTARRETTVHRVALFFSSYL